MGHLAADGDPIERLKPVQQLLHPPASFSTKDRAIRHHLASTDTLPNPPIHILQNGYGRRPQPGASAPEVLPGRLQQPHPSLANWQPKQLPVPPLPGPALGNLQRLPVHDRPQDHGSQHLVRQGLNGIGEQVQHALGQGGVKSQASLYDCVDRVTRVDYHSREFQLLPCSPAGHRSPVLT